MRPWLLIIVSLIASGCARVLRVPSMDTQPIVGTFERGLNQRSKVFDVEVPEVRNDTQRVNSVTFKYGGTKLGGTEQQQQRSHMAVLRSGQPLTDVDCLSQQGGFTVSRTEFSRHTFTCTGGGFQLSLDEPQDDVFVGSARVGPVELALTSSDDLVKGVPQYPTGFHVMQSGQWVASFEYFDGGKAYVHPGLSPVERDAVLSVMVVIQATHGWLAKNLQSNQARPFGM